MVIRYLRELSQATVYGWNRFWFTPSDPATLGLIRILAGSMLFYTHLVWSAGLEAFFGPNAWVTPEAVATLGRGPSMWSYFWLIDSPRLLWAVHIAGLVVFALLTLGLFTRVVSVLAFLITVSYVNRVPGALFGLDQINGLLAMYLMVGPSGACYSLDRWIASRAGGGERVEGRGLRVEGGGNAHASHLASSGANVAIRLIQVHMCVIYFFAGIAKLQGPTWWDGTAMWGAVANLEYQSLDLTWMAAWPRLINLLTHVTVFWEISYCALVWPRLTRPIVVLLAIPLHLGIAFGMGMITFGLVMLIGNLAFVSPALVRAAIGWPLRARSRGGRVKSEGRRVKGRPISSSFTLHG
ncbi:MAG: HTTM domain-containing protein [Planctomycetes bacterium]|nr:HTTM domain-containing protein [Planctomycetota bacterium]